MGDHWLPFLCFQPGGCTKKAGNRYWFPPRGLILDDLHIKYVEELEDKTHAKSHDMISITGLLNVIEG